MANVSDLTEGISVRYAGNWSFEGEITAIEPNSPPRQRPNIHVTADDGTTKSFDAHDLVRIC